MMYEPKSNTEFLRGSHVVVDGESIRVDEDDVVRDECGVFGVYGHPEAHTLTYLGLYALQHRGQEGAGIVCSDEGVLSAYRGVGLVSEVFKPHRLERLEGNMAIGHVRYSTQGSSVLKNVQPLPVDYARGSMAIGHNGNLVNATELRNRLEESGAIFQSTTDSEVIIQLIARSKEKRFVDCVIDALRQVEGAYSIVATNGEEVIAARDPMGIRPLWIGELEGAHLFASESCAFDVMDANYNREVEPGEVVVASSTGLESIHPFEKVTSAMCVFEFIYVARPDSQIFGQSVDEVRKRLGRNLAKILPVDADVVMAVPDSSNPAALGYSHESGIPFDMGFIRSHYIGRTFIEPEQHIRDFGVRIKLNPARSAIEGRRIVLVDDSIVRGTTSQKIIRKLRKCGAKEIHLRISAPPIINSCYYGIDTPEKDQLIASRMSVDEIQEYLGVDTLAYQTIDGLLDAVKGLNNGYCLACFNNKYPTRLPHEYETRPQSKRHVDTSTEPYEGIGGSVVRG